MLKNISSGVLVMYVNAWQLEIVYVRMCVHEADVSRKYEADVN